MAKDISLSYIDGSTINDADAIVQQYEIALFTNPGELSADPDFGIGIKRYIGEVNNEINAKALRQLIVSRTKELFPEISLKSIKILNDSLNTVSVELDIIVIPYAQRRTIRQQVGS